MSGLGLQDAIVGLIAGAALAWLLWRYLRRRKPGASAACENCPSAAASARPRTAPEPVMLIQIGPPSAGPDGSAKR